MLLDAVKITPSPTNNYIPPGVASVSPPQAQQYSKSIVQQNLPGLNHKEKAPEESGRKLLQEDEEAAEVTVVTSAEALRDAVVSGVQHIEIQEHIDLTVLNVNPSFRLGPVPVTVKSIRVRFSVICWPQADYEQGMDNTNKMGVA